jgi:hypothetical protein
MEGIKTPVTENFQNAWIIFIIYEALLFTWNHKNEFMKESGGAFCLRCWKQFEILMNELGAIVENARLHTMN